MPEVSGQFISHVLNLMLYGRTPEVEILITATTPQLEYTDEQFHEDLKKAGRKIDKMAEVALEHMRKGELREFPKL